MQNYLNQTTLPLRRYFYVGQLDLRESAAVSKLASSLEMTFLSSNIMTSFMLPFYFTHFISIGQMYVNIWHT